MKRAVYPGSFDPFTNGHLEVLQIAASLFDHVTVAVLVNPDKTPLFSATERIEQIRRVAAEFHNVSVAEFTGLLADFVRQQGVPFIVRGLREVADYENEVRLANMNYALEPSARTVFLPTRPEVSFISSSLVKQVASYGGDVSPFVPDVVAAALSRRYGQKTN